MLEDDKEAVKWYRKAAEQGFVYAQFNLGMMYRKGEGVLEDDKEAVKWYRKAAEQGFATAQRQLGILYALGQGVLEDYVTSIWANIAGANGCDVKKLKEVIEKKMTNEDISKAQELSARWSKNPKLLK